MVERIRKVPVFGQLAAGAAVDVVALAFAKRIHRMVENKVVVVRINFAGFKRVVIVTFDFAAAGAAIPVFCLIGTVCFQIQRRRFHRFCREFMTERSGGSRIHMTTGLAGTGLAAAVDAVRSVRRPGAVGRIAGNSAALHLNAVIHNTVFVTAGALPVVGAVVEILHRIREVVAERIAVCEGVGVVINAAAFAPDVVHRSVFAIRVGNLMRVVDGLDPFMTECRGAFRLDIAAFRAGSAVGTGSSAGRGVGRPIAVGGVAGNRTVFDLGAVVHFTVGAAAIGASPVMGTIVQAVDAGSIGAEVMAMGRINSLRLCDLVLCRSVAVILAAAGAVPVFDIAVGFAAAGNRRRSLQIGVVVFINRKRLRISRGTVFTLVAVKTGILTGRRLMTHQFPFMQTGCRNRRGLFMTAKRTGPFFQTFFAAGRRIDCDRIVCAPDMGFGTVYTLLTVDHRTVFAAAVLAEVPVRIVIDRDGRAAKVMTGSGAHIHKRRGIVRAVAGAGLVINRVVFAGRRRLQMVHTEGHCGRFDPVVLERRGAFCLNITADRAGPAVRTGFGAGRGVGRPCAVSGVAGNHAVLVLGTVFFFTVGVAAGALPVMGAVTDVVDAGGVRAEIVTERSAVREGFGRVVRAAAIAPFMIDCRGFAGRVGNLMIGANRRHPVVAELAGGLGLRLAAGREGPAVGAARCTGRGVCGPCAVCRFAGHRTVLDLGAVFHFTISAAVVLTGPVMGTVVQAVDRAGIVVTRGGNSRMTAHPRGTSSTIDASRVTARFAGGSNRSAIFGRLVVAGVDGAVCGITMLANRLVNTVCRAAGTGFGIAGNAVETVGAAARTLAVMGTG